jgi:hypothetical protein
VTATIRRLGGDEHGTIRRGKGTFHVWRVLYRGVRTFKDTDQTSAKPIAVPRTPPRWTPGTT